MLCTSGLFAQTEESIERPDTLAASRVVSELNRRENFTQTGLTRIDGKKIRGGYAVFSTPDLIKFIQTLPGVATGTELLSGLYVHGGDGSDNLFLLDGVPLYQVSHLAGLFSSFNTDVVDNMDFYKSGFPARYGGRLSSVVDVRTKDGDFRDYHGTFSLSLIDGRISFGGPLVKDKTSFNFGLRRSWMDVVTIPAMYYINKDNAKYLEPGEIEKYNFHYAFDDFNFRLTHIFSRDSKMRFNFYSGSDGIDIGSYEKSFYDVVYGAGVRQTETSEDDYGIGVKWGNLTASLDWERKFSDKLFSDVKVYYTRCRSNTSFDIKESGSHYADTLSEVNVCNLADIAVTANLDWFPAEKHHVRSGGQYVCHSFNPKRENYYSSVEKMYDDSFFKSSDVSSETFSGHEMDVYAEDEISVSRLLKLNLGLRGVVYSVPGKVRVVAEPRAAMKYQTGEASAVKLSYSEMNQFNHLVAATYLDLPTNCWMPSTSRIRPSLSRQVAGGVYWDWPSGMRLYVEGYYKTMEHLLEYGGQNALFPPLSSWESSFFEGRGRSYGAEFEWGYDIAKWSFAAYYTLSKTERLFEDLYFTWYPDRNDNRHKINLSVNWHPNDKFELYAMWNYHSGNHMTVASHVLVDKQEWTYVDFETQEPVIAYYDKIEDFYSHPNNLQLPDYHRLDVGFNFHRKTRRGNDATWNISVYNAYCRMNPILATVDRNDKHELKEFTYGIVPIIPSLGYTLNF